MGKTETKVDLPLFELLGGKAIKALAAYIAAQVVVTTDAKSSPNGAEPHSKTTNGVVENTVNGKKSGLNVVSNGVNGKAGAYVNGSVDTDALLEWWRQYLANAPTSDPFGVIKANRNGVTPGSTCKTPYYTIPANHVKRMKRICKQDLAMTSPGNMTGSVQFSFILGALWAYLFRCDGARAGDTLLGVVLSGEDAEPVPVRLRLTS